MPSPRQEMQSWTEQQVFDSLSNSQPGSPAHTRAAAEIQRRHVELERRSLLAQEASAQAAFDLAAAARRSTLWAIISAIVAGLSLAVAVAVALHLTPK